MCADPVRILVADDHTLLRQSLCELLRAQPGFDVVAQAGDGPSTLRAAVTHHPDVVLLDVEMPQHDVTDIVRRLLGIDPRLRVIVLSMYDDARLVQELINVGVRGYLHKSVSRESLISAIQGVTDDQPVVTVSVSRTSLAAPAPPDSSQALSARELEVLNFVAAAKSNRQIASHLGITEGTVKRHLRNIFGKLDAVSRIDAVNKAAAMSLISHPAKARRSQVG